MTVSRMWEIEQSGRGVHLNESNPWRDINCDSESELKGVMEPLLLSLPCLNLGDKRGEGQSCLSETSPAGLLLTRPAGVSYCVLLVVQESYKDE